MMQTKLQSLLESFCNIVVGYLVALIAQLIVFPLMDISVRLDQNLAIGAIFTAVSLVRSYALRRVFNWVHRA
jgi:hypothetical protein